MGHWLSVTVRERQPEALNNVKSSILCSYRALIKSSPVCATRLANFTGSACSRHFKFVMHPIMAREVTGRLY
jgi:hypothetical protein